jgi:serine/threonine protein kinase
VTGTFPFQGTTLPDLYQNIITSEIKIPKYVDESLAELIQGMLMKKEEERFNMKKILSHRWFTTKLTENDKKDEFIVDRWRSFSLLPYIAQALDGYSDLPPSLDEIKKEEERECSIM